MERKLEVRKEESNFEKRNTQVDSGTKNIFVQHQRKLRKYSGCNENARCSSNFFVVKHKKKVTVLIDFVSFQDRRNKSDNNLQIVEVETPI